MDRVIPVLLGQAEERTLSPTDVAALRDRLTEWIGVLATARSFSADKLSPNIPVSSLPVQSVALHFRRHTSKSSLTQDFRNESDSHGRLRGITEHLLNEFQVIQQEFQKANPNLGYDDKMRRFESSKEVAAWLLKVKRNLDVINRECALIGYPVSDAWKIREQVEAIQGAFKTIEGKAEHKRSTLEELFNFSPVMVIVTALQEVVNTTRLAGDHCHTLSVAYLDPPVGLDPVILDFAWASLVPLSEPDAGHLAIRLKRAAGWINDAGLKDILSFDRMEFIGPTEVGSDFHCEGVVLVQRFCCPLGQLHRLGQPAFLQVHGSHRCVPGCRFDDRLREMGRRQVQLVQRLARRVGLILRVFHVEERNLERGCGENSPQCLPCEC